MKTLTPVKLSVRAMRTRFELMLYGDDPARLRAAGEEALSEIERLEAQLNFYSPASEIAWINAHAADCAVKVEPRLFRLLRRCAAFARQTEGAFDITVGPLMRAWREAAARRRAPTPDEIEAARSVVGIEHVVLDEDHLTVRFRRRGVAIDLGGYGKGYAVEQAIGMLKENAVASALLHGGTSSVYALGSPPGATSWRVGLGDDFKSGGRAPVINLSNSALSVSAVHGRSFEAEGRRVGHVIDPRTGEPVTGTTAAAVAGASAEACEALSTALVVLGKSWLARLAERFPGYRAIAA